MSPRLILGVFSVSLADAIRAHDLPRIGRLCDHARAGGMDYNELAAIAQRAADIDADEWESILYEVDTAEEER